MINTTAKKQVIVIVVSMLMVSLWGRAAYAQTKKTESLSIQALHIDPGERIVGFEVHVNSGRIVSMPDMPIGWAITVDNDPSWNTKIKGGIQVGAAALTDPVFFKRFLIIERDQEQPPLAPFDVYGEIVVTRDFETERTIKVRLKDFVIERVVAKWPGSGSGPA